MKKILISVAAILCLAAGSAQADPNAETAARASVATAYMDTTVTFTATTGDTIAFGFLADEVQVFANNGGADTLAVTLFRSAATISGGMRTGLRVVASAGVKVPPTGRTFTCAEGFSGLKGIPESTAGNNSIYTIIASVRNKR